MEIDLLICLRADVRAEARVRVVMDVPQPEGGIESPKGSR